MFNIVRYALKNISRNLFLSLSSVLVIGLLVFFVNILWFVIFSTDQFIAHINERIAISINLQSETDSRAPRFQEFLSWIRSTFSGVTVDYISKESAFGLLRDRNPDLAMLIEQNDDNPLPDSVRMSNIELDQYQWLNTYIAGFQDVLQYEQTSFDKKLVDYRVQYEKIASVVRILQLVKIAVYVLLGLFLFTASIVLYMVIHNFIFFLQDEIRIIELVWGRPSFIYGPFFVQGILYAALASLMAVWTVWLLIFIALQQSVFSDFTTFLRGFSEIFASLYWIVILTFSFIGGVSAFLASWRYIHTTIWE